MNFFVNDKPPGVPHLVVKLWKVLGVSDVHREQYRCVPIFVTFLLIIAIPKIFFGYPDFKSGVIGLAELVCQTNRFIGVLLLALYRDVFYELIRQAECFTRDVLSGSPPIAKHLKTQDARINKVMKVCLLSILLPANFYSYSPILSTLWRYYSAPANATDVQFTLYMEENFYGLNVRTSLRDYLLFGVFMVPTSFLCAFVGSVKIVAMLAIIKYCTVYFQLVALKIQYTARERSFRSELKTIVQMHQGALNCAELLRTLTAPVMLMQIILCVLNWSSMLLYFTVSGFSTQFINLLVLFMFETIETFGYCYLGNQLSDAAAKVAGAVYESCWEAECASVQKDLQLIIVRTQKPIGITAGEFCDLNMELFGV
ncbi:putative odorant receptor 92a, partial [Anopheles bellator]|uniref:putative odorant receptor 92a n=1 Tax=Anopheles bellator TaxID=139047 RepID=UPI00264741ED